MENFQSVALSSTTKRPALLEDQGEVEQYISDKTSISAKYFLSHLFQFSIHYDHYFIILLFILFLKTYQFKKKKTIMRLEMTNKQSLKME